jgi:DNA-binding winged helix-turn-helix (wHTH) protein
MTMFGSTVRADWPETGGAPAHRGVSHALLGEESIRRRRQVSEGFSPAADRSAAAAERVASFGSFRLFPRQRLLLQGEKPLPLGSRALDILIALVERPGELVSKKELMARVWPDTVVEEGNLKVHVSALRRTLADGKDGHRYLATIPGRGYRFVAPVVVAEEPRPAAPAHAHEALGFSAVQLSVERSIMGEAVPADGDAPRATEICRKLDGIALALESATARVEALMSATLGWSYGLLTPGEQAVLRRLAIFGGSFTLRGAVAVAADRNHSEDEVITQLGALVAKLLVTTEGGGVEQRFHLLDAARAYLLKKLAESGESELIRQRRAAYHCDALEAAA